MKHLITFTLVAAATISLIACQNSGGGNSGGSTNQQYASTPQPCNALNSGSQNAFGTPSNCSQYNSYYSGSANQYSWNYGAWIWPTQYSASNGQCGCPTGYFPVQSAYYGVACAPNAYQQNSYYGGGLVYFSYGSYPGYWNYSQNGGWLNRPQAVYQPANGTGTSCGASTAQGCDVRTNSCPAGSRCQAVAGGSTIGLCVR